MMSLSFSSSTSREADRPKDDKAFVQQDQDMATVAVIPHWCDSLIMLHPFLYSLLCPNATPNKCCCKRCAVDYTLRAG